MTTYASNDADDKNALGITLYQYDPQAQAPDPNKPGGQGKRGFRSIHGFKNEGTIGKEERKTGGKIGRRVA